jgi:hypothetical protein
MTARGALPPVAIVSRSKDETDQAAPARSSSSSAAAFW